MSKKLPGLQRTQRPKAANAKGTSAKAANTKVRSPATKKPAAKKSAAKAKPASAAARKPAQQAAPKAAAQAAAAASTTSGASASGAKAPGAKVSGAAASRATASRTAASKAEPKRTAPPPPPPESPRVEVPDEKVEIVDPNVTTPLERAERAERRHQEARKVVARYAAWSSAGGLIPLPYVNVMSVTAVQITMVVELARLYGVPYSREAVGSILGAIVGGAVPYAVSAGTVGLLFKSMPGIGLAVGLAGMAGLSNVATRTLGRLFVSHFESGGDLSDVDTGTMSRDYAEGVKGKKAA